MKTNITSAYANKLLRKLKEEKSYWVNKEQDSCTYIAAVGEEPVIPEYDYADVAAQIAAIDEQICKIKHAVNLSNVTSTITVNGQEMSVDAVLVTMAQLNKRKDFLDTLRKHLPKQRVDQLYSRSLNRNPEYEYTNYDLELVKSEYEQVSKKIMDMQMALDIHNQTELFEVEL